MFKCAICGKEYSDNDRNEIRLLNKKTGEMEIFYVCTTCLNNKEDMVAYLAGKKAMSSAEARHIYDYFLPMMDSIESPLLAKYIEVRMRALRARLADEIEENIEATAPKDEPKKKTSVFRRLKTALISLDAVVSISVFVVLTIIANVNPIITAGSVIMGIILAIAIFVAGYFVIDSYIRMREDSFHLTEKILSDMMASADDANGHLSGDVSADEIDSNYD